MESKIIYSVPGVYDSLEHTGDVYIRARGENILELFENSAKALFDTMTDINKVSGVFEREVVVDGFDLENLLYRWLEAMLILYYSENLVCSDIRAFSFRVKRSNSELSYEIRGMAYCEKFDLSKHEPRVEVKAATYSLMRVIKTEKEWLAYFVLDI
ncbi:MAG: archease [Desulfurococcaceae archaeon]